MRRLGLSIYSRYYVEKTWLSDADIIECAKLADKKGFESIWLNEDKGRDSMVLFGAMSILTQRAKLATGIVTIYGRSAVQIAMGIATVHELSAGRAILGMSTGHYHSVTAGHGLPIRDPLPRIREYVELIRKLLSKKRFDHEGPLYKIQNGKLGFEPPPPDIPIYIAARAPNLTRLTGEIADGLLLFLSPAKWIKSAVIEQLREGAEKAHRDYRELDVACEIPCYLTDDREHAVYIAKKATAQYCNSPSVIRRFVRFGFSPSALENVGAALEKDGLEKAATLVPDDMAEAFVLSGNVNRINRGIEEYMAAGVKLPILVPLCFSEGKSVITNVIEISDQLL